MLPAQMGTPVSLPYLRFRPVFAALRLPLAPYPEYPLSRRFWFAVFGLPPCAVPVWLFSFLLTLPPTCCYL